MQSNDRSRGPQRYHLDVAAAGLDDTLPGRRLGRRARGALRGGKIDVVDLYRFDIVRRSNVSLRLRTGSDNAFDLLLLRQSGRSLECACGERGSVRSDRRLRPGRYYAAVRADAASAGRYLLRRIVRTITATRITIDGARKAGSAPGRPVTIRASVRPRVGGPVTILVERFDPLFGFQFARRYRTRASGGTAAVSFRPPAIGRYRASAVFRGTRSAAPSESGFAGLLVAEPLRP